MGSVIKTPEKKTAGGREGLQAETKRKEKNETVRVLDIRWYRDETW